MPTTSLVYKEDFNPLRVDKNIAFNILAFRAFDEDAKILKAILLYMAINHQEEDLFGFYKIDPKKFSKMMFLNESHLFRMHPRPFFIENDPNARVRIENEQKHGRMSHHRTWSTYFENALYILTNKSIIDDYRIKEGNKSIISTQRFNFIDEIRFELIKTGKTKRIMYYYKPNKKYEDNLKTYFLNSKIEKYNSLKKPKLDEAYLDILNRINNANAKGLNSIAFSADGLALILQIKKYKRFSAYKTKITEKFEVLKKTIADDVKGLDLTWANPKDSLGAHISNLQKNTPKVIYKNVPIVSWDRLTKEQKTKNDSKIFKNLFDTELTRALIVAFFNTNQAKLTSDEEQKKIAFYRWIFSDIDMDIKEIKFKDTYVDVYKNTKSLKAFSDDYTKVLNYLSKVQAKHNCISHYDDKLYLQLKDKKIEFKHLYELLNYVKEYLIK